MAPPQANRANHQGLVPNPPPLSMHPWGQGGGVSTAPQSWSGGQALPVGVFVPPAGAFEPCALLSLPPFTVAWRQSACALYDSGREVLEWPYTIAVG